MFIKVNKTRILLKCEKKINSGVKLLFVDCTSSEIIYLLLSIIKNKGLKNVEIWQCTEDASIRDCSTYITKQEMDEMLRMHHIYDFSDNVFIISDSDQYGSLFNYVNNGILTKQEMVEALLYRI